MRRVRKETRVVLAVLAAAILTGCSAPKVQVAELKRPDRAKELDAFNVFVGSWNWEATMENADNANKSWTGTADWQWTLDQRCLHGQMASRSAGGKEFKAGGMWSWHPTQHQYMWSMFNDWGYPQEGTADYDDNEKEWEMKYKAVGLDGTASYGVYELKIVDNNTIKWTMTEWADVFHMAKKMHMTGCYKRK